MSDPQSPPVRFDIHLRLPSGDHVIVVPSDALLVTVDTQRAPVAWEFWTRADDSGGADKPPL